MHWVLALAETPNAKFPFANTNMLVSKNAKICFTPNAKPQRKSVEYRLCWVPNAEFSCWPCTFHFFVSISFALGPVFSVEYGLNGDGEKLFFFTFCMAGHSVLC